MEDFKIRLRQAMDKNNISQSELAKITGLWPSAISDYLKGKYLANQDKVDILAKALNVSPVWLMGLDGNKNDFETSSQKIENIFSFNNITPITTKKVPLLGEIACGEPIYADEDRESYVEVGTDIKCDFALKAKGDSMIGARINNGDIVFIRKQSSVNNGEIAAIIIDDEATLKRVEYLKENNILLLKAENPAIDTIAITDETLNTVRILGKAVAFQSDVL